MQNHWNFNGKYECAMKLAKRCEDDELRFHVQSKLHGDLHHVIDDENAWF